MTSNWNSEKKSASCECAFTFIELIAVVAGITLLACAALPALARSKTRTPAAGCLSNLRQMQVAWAMYADDNKGVLMGNAPAGSLGSTAWCAGSEDWTINPYNTNVALYSSGQMARYTGTNVAILRCPGDVVPSKNGFRLRSYSMNGQVGTSLDYNGGRYRLYRKESDIVCPSPANLFVFCDEHPGSISDGFLQVNLTAASFPDVPASYLDNGCGFSFADGHAEIHKWQGTGLLIPVVQGVRFSNLASSSTDPDWNWLTSRSSCRIP